MQPTARFRAFTSLMLIGSTATTPYLEKHFGPRSEVQEGPEGAEDLFRTRPPMKSLPRWALTRRQRNWSPSTPNTPDNPSELEIASAADNLEIIPNSLGALPHLWLQAKLTISLAPVLDKLAGRISLMRRAESLATPETECFLYAIPRYIGFVRFCPSGPVKAVVSQQPQSTTECRNWRTYWSLGPLCVVSSWASRIAPAFLGDEGSKLLHRRSVLLVPIELGKECSPQLKNKLYRQLDSWTRMPPAWALGRMRNSNQRIVSLWRSYAKAIVLDRPLAEAQALVDQPRQFLQEIKQVQRIPVWSKCYKPYEGTLRRKPQAVPVATDASSTGTTNFSNQYHEKLRPPGGAPGWLFLLRSEGS